MPHSFSTGYPPSNEWLNLAEVGRYFATEDRPVGPCAMTIRNWVNKGIKTPAGRVFLRTFKVGGKRYTTLSALHRFVAEQNATGPTEAMLPITRDELANRELLDDRLNETESDGDQESGPVPLRLRSEEGDKGALQRVPSGARSGDRKGGGRRGVFDRPRSHAPRPRKTKKFG